MRRSSTILYGLVIVVLTTGCAQHPAATQAGEVKQSSKAMVESSHHVEPRIDRKLNELISIDAKEVPLVDVVAFFRTRLDINIIPNWAALEAAGIEQDLPVTLTLDHVPASQVLTFVLKQAGAGAELEPIGFKVRGNIVDISTLRDLQRRHEVQMFHIGELLYPPVDRKRAARWQPLLPDMAAPDESARVGREEVVEQIINLIQPTIGRKGGDWQAFGGIVSSVREFNGVLIVKTTPDNMRDIQLLLRMVQASHFEKWLHIFRDEQVATLLTEARQHQLAGRLDDAKRHVWLAFDVQSDHAATRAMARGLGVILPKVPVGGYDDAYEDYPFKLIEGTRIDTQGRSLAVMAHAGDADRRAWRKLLKRSDVHYKAEPIGKVFEQLKQRTGTNLVTNWAALEAAGIEPDVPIVIQLKDVPLHVILDRVLAQAGAGAELEPIGWTIDRGVVRISTERDLNRAGVRKTYNIEDLIQLMLQTRGPDFDDSDEPICERVEESELREDAIEMLVNMIQDLVGSQEHWEAYGGTISSLKEINGRLVIKTSPPYHRVIQSMLDVLRTTLAKGLDVRLHAQQVLQLHEKAQTLRLSGQHKQALSILDEILRLKPNDLRALAMRTVIKQTLARRQKRLDSNS